MSSDTGAIALPSSIQIGVVVKDIDKTTKFLSSIWGLGPWEITEFAFSRDDLIVGEPFRIKVAYAKLGATKLELVQPLEGRSIFSQFLETKGEGLYNVNFRVSNYDDVVSKLQEHGGKMILGIALEGKRYGYFDTKTGGIIVEFAEE